MQSRTVVFVLAVIALGWAARPPPRNRPSPGIVGTITDPNGGILPGVAVTVTASSTGTVCTAVSDGQGRYTVSNLAPGSYQVALELSGSPTRRDMTLGVGDAKAVDVAMPVAGCDRSGPRHREASPLDTESARIGVNVSPAEIEQLPVNGRNFANLMTLATGATTDGNGGWASVRFNGKSNQQNYLNYDGVDGTYVWDASPGYLNATGSQFRLQTSMESIAEFRVNSGLAPAESGLGAGGNITVISKSGSGSPARSSSSSGTTRSTPRASTTARSRISSITSSEDRSAARSPPTRPSSSPATKGSSRRPACFTEAVPSDEAIRRIQAGEPVGSGAGQSAARTQAVAPLLAGFPRGTAATANPLALATLNTQADQREHTVSFRVDHRFTNNQSLYGA